MSLRPTPSDDGPTLSDDGLTLSDDGPTSSDDRPTAWDEETPSREKDNGSTAVITPQHNLPHDTASQSNTVNSAFTYCQYPDGKRVNQSVLEIFQRLAQNAKTADGIVGTISGFIVFLCLLVRAFLFRQSKDLWLER